MIIDDGRRCESRASNDDGDTSGGAAAVAAVADDDDDDDEAPAADEGVYVVCTNTSVRFYEDHHLTSPQTSSA